MKSRRSLLFCAVVCFIIGCGGNGGGTGVIGGKPRMLVSDNTSGTVSVVDAQTDTVIATVSMPSPGKIVSAGGVAVIQSTAANSVTVFDNASQTIRVTAPLPALPVDIAITPSGQTAWVAENNGTIQSISLTGATAGAIGATVSMAGVQRLVMGPQGLTVLAFNDALAINFGFVNTQTSIFVPLGNAGLDHPANGAFLGDDNNFWVFDCGTECAGAQANVSRVVLNLPGGPAISLGATLSGATVGLTWCREENSTSSIPHPTPPSPPPPSPERSSEWRSCSRNLPRPAFFLSKFRPRSLPQKSLPKKFASIRG